MIVTEKELLPIRAFLETAWHDLHKSWQEDDLPKPVSRYMCRYTCVFLKEIFNKKYNLTVEIITGCPTQEKNGTVDGIYGFKDVSGCWHDHSWISLNGQIFDLTADQFGDKKIIITDVQDNRYKASTDQSVFIPAYNKMLKNIEKWIVAYENN